MAAFQNQQARTVISSKPPMSMPSYGSQRGFQAYGPNNTPAAQEWERRWGRVVNGRKSSDLDIGPADDRRQADELAAWQQYGYDAVNRQPPPAYVDYGPGTPGVQKPQYGSRIGMPDGAIRTMDHIDSDGDGIDDRSQSGPGQRPSAGGSSYRPPASDPAWGTRYYHMGDARPKPPASQGTPYGQQQIARPTESSPFGPHPADFEGPLPGPRDPQGRQARIDDIYNQLINGGYNAHLRGKNHAGATHVLQQNARRLATRLAADGVPARYFDQYGIRPPGSQPGAAQPVDPQSPGTPYNPGFGDDVRYLPGDPRGGQQGAGSQAPQPRPNQPPLGQPMFGPYGQPNGQDPVSQLGQMYQQQMLAWAQPKQQLLQWGQQQSQMPWGPNYGNTPDSRPDPWSQQVSGPFGNDPNGMWNNMSGFIQSVNNQAMQKPVGVYQGQGNPGANYGKQTYDIRSLINQGNQMVQGGWQNPFMGQMQQMQQVPGEVAFNSYLQSQGVPPMPMGGAQAPTLPASAYINAGPDYAAPAGYEYNPNVNKNGQGAGWYDTAALQQHSNASAQWNAGGREQAMQSSLAAMYDWQSKYGGIANQYKSPFMPYSRPGQAYPGASPTHPMTGMPW